MGQHSFADKRPHMIITIYPHSPARVNDKEERRYWAMASMEFEQASA